MPPAGSTPSLSPYLPPAARRPPPIRVPHPDRAVACLTRPRGCVPFAPRHGVVPECRSRRRGLASTPPAPDPDPDPAADARCCRRRRPHLTTRVSRRSRRHSFIASLRMRHHRSPARIRPSMTREGGEVCRRLPRPNPFRPDARTSTPSRRRRPRRPSGPRPHLLVRIIRRRGGSDGACEAAPRSAPLGASEGEIPWERAVARSDAPQYPRLHRWPRA